jgi:hypothetical protein
MDIAVTIPKSELKNVQKEEDWAEKHKDEAVICFWKIRGVPKKLNKDDRVYFIENGMITSYNIFKYCDWDLTCEVTGRFWEGLNLVMEAPAIILKKPVPMRGSQGFRYIERIE